jgi:integrase
MPASKHQLPASAYHLKPSDVRKLLLSASNFRDRCLIKTLWWLGVRRSELINLDVRDFDAKRKRITSARAKAAKHGSFPSSMTSISAIFSFSSAVGKPDRSFSEIAIVRCLCGRSTTSWRLSELKLE